MNVLIAYDVATESRGGRRRLRKIAQACLDFGQRVQKSVFECVVDPARWTELRFRLLKEVDLKEDSLRFYFLGKNWERRREHVGLTPAYEPGGCLIF